jgi:hypothetical protein
MPDNSGTWLRRLDGDAWQSTLQLSTSTNFRADVVTDGNLAHVLLFNGSNSRLASLEYSNGTDSYGLWSQRTSLTSVPLASNAESATITVDTAGRLWVASDRKFSIGPFNGADFEVRYSDANYTSFSDPISLGTSLDSDDLSAITSLPDGSIGVMWSNQSEQRFSFREHTDGGDPAAWSTREIAASQAALNIGAGMADDHINFAFAADGTLYVAVKTSYDNSGQTKLGLLVRRPTGEWDDSLYHVDFTGTRPIVLLDESIGRLMVAYTENDSASNIVFRESPLDDILFSQKHTLLAGNFNDVTAMKQAAAGELVVMATGGGQAHSVRLAYALPEPGTAALLSAGFVAMIGMAGVRRRKNLFSGSSKATCF